MAEKDKIASTSSETPVARRSFFTWLWIGLGLVAVAELVWLVGSFLRFGRYSKAAKTSALEMVAGPVKTFSPGSVTAFPRGRFYLARLEDGGFLALSRRCPHLGCTLPWVEAEKRFVCPCHSSAFDIRGDVLRSPAPRAMAVHPVVIENGVVRVDTSRVAKRNRFQSRQVAYATPPLPGKR